MSSNGSVTCLASKLGWSPCAGTGLGITSTGFPGSEDKLTSSSCRMAPLLSSCDIPGEVCISIKSIKFRQKYYFPQVCSSAVYCFGLLLVQNLKYCCAYHVVKFVLNTDYFENRIKCSRHSNVLLSKKLFMFLLLSYSNFYNFMEKHKK